MGKRDQTIHIMSHAYQFQGIKFPKIKENQRNERYIERHVTTPRLTLLSKQNLSNGS